MRCARAARPALIVAGRDVWHDLLVAIALVLVLEGIVPFLNPQAMRRAMLALANMNDSTLRFAGLTVMVVGCLLLYVVR